MDTTLNQIVAKFYTTQNEIHENFQWRTITGADQDATFSPAVDVAYHPAYSVKGTTLEDAQWYLYGTAPDGGMPVGMHLDHLANHPGDFCDGLYQTTVKLRDGGQGITAQETDVGWSALLVEQYKLHTRDSDTPHTDLTGDNLTDLTALFTGDVTVKVKNDPIVGKLAVQKTVAGNAGETDKEWNFTVMLGDTSISGTYGDMSFTGGMATFTLKHGDRKTARGLPAGISYTVTEAEANKDGYVTTPGGTIRGNIEANATATAVFTNTRNAYGGLTVTKTVRGKAEDFNKEWNFTVTLDDTNVNGVYGDMMFYSGVAHFPLKHGDSATALGLPAGVSYHVREALDEEYNTSSYGADGKIPQNDAAQVQFINDRIILLPKTDDGSPTGLWIMLMLLSLCGLGALALGRRRQNKTR